MFCNRKTKIHTFFKISYFIIMRLILVFNKIALFSFKMDFFERKKGLFVYLRRITACKIRAACSRESEEVGEMYPSVASITPSTFKV